MKFTRLLSSLSGLVLAASAAAQTSNTIDVAPLNLSDFVFTAVPSNATGSSGISSIFSSSGTQLTFGTGGSLVNPMDFNYTVTGPNTATISYPATASSQPSTTNLVFTSPTAGTYTTVSGTNTTTGRFSLADIPAAAPIENVSTRTTVSPSAPTIVGFVIGGTMPRRVLIRAVGPGLAPFGVTDPLANPSLALYRGTQQIAMNDDWETLAALSSGATAGSNSSTSLSGTTTSSTINTGTGSTTGSITGTGSTGSMGLTTGTGATSGTGTSTMTGTTTNGVFSGILSNGEAFSTQLATAASFTQAGAFALRAGSRDSAFVVTLPPGAYSVIVTSSTATATAATSTGTTTGTSSTGTTTIGIGTTSGGITSGTGSTGTGSSSPSTGSTSSTGTVSTTGGTASGSAGTATGSTSGGTLSGGASSGTGSNTTTSSSSTTIGPAAANTTTGEVLVEVYFLE